ncbi:hypothetical protein [Pseudoxanthomonas sp. 10H]|uniref:hypothetical protein n=1 Tax=Pseudoxanthomonas sp. 10H TaxID=3242729 RepID=UPI0035575B77
MQRRRMREWFVLSVVLAAAAFASNASAQSSGPAPLQQQMTPEEFRAAGLHKLSTDELAALQQWLRRQPHAAAAAGGELSPTDVERIREEAREQGRQEVKEKNRGFFSFDSEEPIKSTLVGEFRGFGQGRHYTLANGQVWEQVEPAKLSGVIKTDPPVTIRPGLFNTWYLRIDGYGTAAKVRRIK